MSVDVAVREMMADTQAQFLPRRAQLVIDRAFGLAVRLRHEVRRALAADLQVFDFTEIAAQARAGLAGGTLHHPDQA